MVAFLSENLATIVGAFIILCIFIATVAKQIKDKKSHKGGCGCGCSGCPSSGMCHPK